MIIFQLLFHDKDFQFTCNTFLYFVIVQITDNCTLLFCTQVPTDALSLNQFEIKMWTRN